LSEIVQKTGIEVKAEQKPKAPASSSAPRRRHFWDEEEQTETPSPAPIVEAKKIEQPTEPKINRVQEGSLEVNEVHEKSPLGFNQSGSIGSKGFIEEPNRVQKRSIESTQKSSLEVNRVQFGSTNPNEPSIGEAKVLRWLNDKKLEDLTIFFRAEECSLGTGLTREGTKTAVKRLRGKGLIELLQARRGRYTAFGLYRITKKGEDFLSRKSPTLAPFNWVQEGSLGFNNRVQIGSYSSSKLENSNTTTTDEPFWLNIPENLKGQIQINQLRGFVKSGVIDQETLQNSLLGFAHDLEKNLVRSKNNNPIALFIGSLKNGGYISHQFLSQQQAELKKLQERAEESKRVQAEIETLRLTEAFEKFRTEFPEKAEALKPASSYVKNFETGSIGYKLWLDEFKKSQETEQSQ
jgi:hypothetical protein